MNTETTELPPAFAHLTPYLGWSLPTETARNARRNSSDIESIRAFAQAMLADVDAIVKHLDAFPLNEMPPAETRLMYMLLSLAEVAPAVESYGQPGVIDGYDPSRLVADASFVMTPCV